MNTDIPPQIICKHDCFINLLLTKLIKSFQTPKLLSYGLCSCLDSFLPCFTQKERKLNINESTHAEATTEFIGGNFSASY